MERLGQTLLDTIRTRGRGLKNAFAHGGVGNVVVLESDDWGSQRVPGVDAARYLLRSGILSGRVAYDREMLEVADDLWRLQEVLSSVKGADNLPAVMTCFVNPANPDFERIRESGFETYFWEPTRAAHERRGDLGAVRQSWGSALQGRVIELQYHGREHLQVRSWLQHLRSGNKAVRSGFDLGYYSVSLNDAKPVARDFRAAYLFSDISEVPEMEEITCSGAKLFLDEHGVSPSIFCPPNNVFHPELYGAVRRAGCAYILSQTHNLQPDGKGGAKDTWGQRGVRESGLVGYGRNALFEPEQGFPADYTLGQVRSAFAWGVPAIISTHRVNYVGGIDPAVRDRGAKALSDLLRRIVATWPDVRFMSSSRLMQELSARG